MTRHSTKARHRRTEGGPRKLTPYVVWMSLMFLVGFILLMAAIDGAVNGIN